MAQDITVLLATYNRAAILRETLDALTRVRRGALDVRIVIVNNGSRDDTDAVLRNFEGKLPVTRLWEPKAGKSHALNRALDTVDLGEIVVFTDDDVTPEESWFENIVAVSRRWPEHSIFGGTVEPAFPKGVQVASWALLPEVQEAAFTRHVVSDREGEYPSHKEPYGPNFWVRRAALEGVRFLGGLGPQPTGRKMGCETQLLRQLRRRGFSPIYSPEVVVQHRIEPERLTKAAIYRRAIQLGRGSVYTQGLPNEALLSSSLRRWRLERVNALVRHAFELPLAAATRDPDARVRGVATRLALIGFDLEALQFARGPEATRATAEAS